MTKFDVFISGIHTGRLDESEKIKQDLARFLKMEPKKIEQLLGKSSNKRIFQNISGQAAEQHQQDLFAIGITSTYRPGTGAIELSLVAIEEEKNDANTCPSCEYETPVEEGKERPDKCPKCGVSKQRFLEVEKANAEKEEIKQRLLRTEKSKNVIEKIKRDVLEEEKRQKQLEEEIKKELDIKKDKTPLIYAAGVLIIAAIGYGIYPYFSQSDELPDTSLALNESDSLAAAQGSQQTSQPLSRQHSTQHIGTTGSTPGQQSMQQTYERTSEVLDAFGLDASAFGGNHAAGGAPMTGGDAALLSMGENNALTMQDRNQMLATATAFLLNEEISQQIWERFLVNQILVKIDQQKEQTAFRLSQYISDTKRFIEVQGRLLTMTSKTKNKNRIYADIEAKIAFLPQGKQVQFLAQAGLQQYKIDQTHSLLDQASDFEKTLTVPEEQLDAVLNLGVAYFKLGSVNIANQYFGKINNLVSKISSSDKKIRARIAIAKAYKNAGSQAIAHQWLLSTKKLIPSASHSAYTEIVTAYAYLDQLKDTLKAIQLRPLHVSQDELLYQAIQVFISTESYNNANALLSRIQGANYKAATYLFMAANMQKNSHYLAFAEKLINNQMNSPLDKAILSSQVALQYAMQSNHQKTKTLYQLTKSFLNSVTSSVARDKALKIVTLNYIRTLNPDFTPALLDLIQSPSLRSSLEVEKIKAQKIKTLIN